MSKDQDFGSTRELIDELESLHGALGTVDAAGLKGTGDMDEIPILLDIIKPSEEKSEKESGGNPISSIYRKILKTNKPHEPTPMDLSLIPVLYPEASDEENLLTTMIDGLVAKYLPILEAELREKIRERFSEQNKIH